MPVLACCDLEDDELMRNSIKKYSNLCKMLSMNMELMLHSMNMRLRLHSMNVMLRMHLSMRLLRRKEKLWPDSQTM